MLQAIIFTSLYVLLLGLDVPITAQVAIWVASASINATSLNILREGLGVPIAAQSTFWVASASSARHNPRRPETSALGVGRGIIHRARRDPRRPETDALGVGCDARTIRHLQLGTDMGVTAKTARSSKIRQQRPSCVCLKRPWPHNSRRIKQHAKALQRSRILARLRMVELVVTLPRAKGCVRSHPRGATHEKPANVQTSLGHAQQAYTVTDLNFLLERLDVLFAAQVAFWVTSAASARRGPRRREIGELGVGRANIQLVTSASSARRDPRRPENGALGVGHSATGLNVRREGLDIPLPLSKCLLGD